jgi:CBS domain containing-hemolysin-like protein
VTALLIVLTAALIALNAFFVMGEYALVRSRRSRLEALKEEGDKRAPLVLDQIEEISDYISASQVGITFTSIGIGAVGEPVVAHALEKIFPESVSHGLAVVISVTVAYMIITSAHIVAGELVPKLYVIQHAEAVARRISRPFRFSRRLFSPLIVVLTGVSHWILRRLGVDPEAEDAEGGTPEELKAIIAESYTGGKIDPGEAGMLAGVFHLHEQEARQVMTPIPAVVTVDLSEDVETALRRCISSGHTRLVVTEDDNRDRVRGIVHSNSLARALMAEGPQASLEPLVREAVIVPETKPLDDLLADLQRQRSSISVVVDEYGRVVGIVTVEDIIEEVVGEIDDETDPAGGHIRRLANGDWFVRGHVAVTDLLDYGVELPVDTDAYNSVGGFVFAQLGRLPKRGDTITADGYSIRVESVRENRIEAVRIRERRPQQGALSGSEQRSG